MKQESKNKFLKRLKIIEGQIRGLQKMLHDNAYCVDILTQTSAVKKAICSFEDVLLESHLSTCVVEQIKSGKHAKAVAEVMKVHRLSKKDN
ncbi:MAG TPA: metal-sensitive transcriptional regulator [Candidatus Udaeobacter sp.]|nr:metal-sensitive transcriptional regulator [Candidatus Udaeobacter sp.]